MRSYESARNLFSFLGFCAGVLIVLGVIVAFLGGSAAQSFARNVGPVQIVLGAMPGIMMVAVGVFGQAMIQMGRASVDTAELTQQSLQVSRDHMELSKQLLEQGRTTAASFASLKPLPPAASGDTQPAPDQTTSYASQQPPMAENPISPNTAQTALEGPAAKPASDLKAITQEEQIPLTQLSSDIVYKDGKYLVGDKPFWSKDEALEHQQTLALVPAK